MSKKTDSSNVIDFLQRIPKERADSISSRLYARFKKRHHDLQKAAKRKPAHAGTVAQSSVFAPRARHADGISSTCVFLSRTILSSSSVSETSIA